MPSREQCIEVYERAYSSRERLPYGGATRSHKMVLNRVPLLRDKGILSILEVGCGRGKVLRELIRHGFAVWGTECVAHLLSHELSSLPVYPYMIHEMGSLPDKSSDMTLAIDVVDHLPSMEDVDLAIGEMFRLARKCVMLVINGDPYLQTVVEDVDYWLRKLYKHNDFVELMKDKRGGILMTCWLPEDKNLQC